MRRLISFIVFLFIKFTAKFLFRFEIKWLSEEKSFDNIRLGMLLNHTSLYDPIYLSIAPISFLWKLSGKFVAPAADKTLNRPIVGFIWKLLSPGIIAITRKKDKSWRKFLEMIENKSIVMITPEGRMKRPTGLDSNGRPMTVRSGVAEIIEVLHEGNILMVYSGGLHHIQAPGQFIPKLFKTIKVNIEIIPVQSYKTLFTTEGIPFRRDVIADLETRIREKCPR